MFQFLIECHADVKQHEDE